MTYINGEREREIYIYMNIYMIYIYIYMCVYLYVCICVCVSLRQNFGTFVLVSFTCCTHVPGPCPFRGNRKHGGHRTSCVARFHMVTTQCFCLFKLISQGAVLCSLKILKLKQNQILLKSFEVLLKAFGSKSKAARPYFPKPIRSWRLALQGLDLGIGVKN